MENNCVTASVEPTRVYLYVDGTQRKADRARIRGAATSMTSQVAVLGAVKQCEWDETSARRNTGV